MAVPDEDWKKFMNSIDEDPEDVETDPDEDAEDEDPDDPDEQDPDKKKPTKSKKAEDEDPDDPEEDEDPDEGEDDDPEEDPDKDKDYKPRLKQFINKDGSFNTKGIEDAYVESGKQAVKLNGQLKEVQGNYSELLGAIKANPEVAEKLFGKQGAKQLLENDNIPTKSGNGGGDGGKNGQPDLSGHPLIRHINAQLNNQSKKEYNDFVEAHPEAVTDPTKAEKIGEFLKYYGPYYSSTHDGEIAPMKVALEAAYREFGWPLDEPEKKESVATAAKKTAATRRSGGAKRSATKKEVSKGEEFFAKKLGVKLRS